MGTFYLVLAEFLPNCLLMAQPVHACSWALVAHESVDYAYKEEKKSVSEHPDGMTIYMALLNSTHTTCHYTTVPY